MNVTERLAEQRLHDERVESDAQARLFWWLHLSEVARAAGLHAAEEVPLPDEPQWGTGAVPLPEDMTA